MTLSIVALLVASTAHAQDQKELERRRLEELKVQTAAGLVAARVPLEKTVKGAPYSGETITERTQSLPDGNRIATRITARVYRDGEGRIRREEDHDDGTMTVSIFDPVAGVSYRLNPQEHVAWKTNYTADVGAIMNKAEAARTEERRKVELAAQAGARGRGAAAGGLEPARGEVKMRGEAFKMAEPGPIEHKTLEGIPVEGRKTTMTIPPGQIGNDLPLTIASEEWSSPDLKVLVLTRHSDPRTGDSSYRLTNIVRAEPDPSLFQVPPGYTIKDTGVRRDEQR
jgi:hypothetical protein